MTKIKGNSLSEVTKSDTLPEDYKDTLVSIVSKIRDAKRK